MSVARLITKCDGGCAATVQAQPGMKGHHFSRNAKAAKNAKAANAHESVLATTVDGGCQEGTTGASPRQRPRCGWHPLSIIVLSRLPGWRAVGSLALPIAQEPPIGWRLR